MLCLVLSAMTAVFGMMLFLKNTRKGRKMAKKARRLGRDMEDMLSF